MAAGEINIRVDVFGVANESGGGVGSQGAGSIDIEVEVEGVGVPPSKGAGSIDVEVEVKAFSAVVIDQLSENPKTYVLNVRDVRIGANGIVEFDFIRTDRAIYPGTQGQSPLLSTGTPAGTPAPANGGSNGDNADSSRPGTTQAVFVDGPQLLGEHTGPGWYVAATGLSDGWSAAILFEKKGADFVKIGELPSRAVLGRAETKLNSGDVTEFDETGRTYVFDDVNTVDVTIRDGVSALASASDASLQAGTNIAAIGAHGRWEIIAYGTATQLSARKWRLSHLLRGLKGTEWAVGLHKTGDHFVLLDSAIRRITDSYSDLNVERIFRVVSVGNDVEDASNRKFTNTGVSLKPLSPVFIRGEEDGDGNRVIRWYDRSRYDGLAGRDGTDSPPPDESLLRWEVDIYNAAGSSVVRTIKASSEFVVYSAAAQTADHGSVPASLKVKIVKVSQTVGDGYEAIATISSFDSATIDPTVFDRIYDVYVYPEGAQQPGRRILVAPIVRPIFFPAGMALSWLKAGGDPQTTATADSTYSLQKNGVEFGTATIPAGESQGVMDSDADTVIDPTAGDSFEVVEPAVPDITLRDVGLGFAGYRI